MNARVAAASAAFSRDNHVLVSEIFGQNVFTLKTLESVLPKPVFAHFVNQVKNGTTAEKHDSFLTLKTSVNNGLEEARAIDALSGSQLLQSEPDASSFPSGGVRSTFEARGYTIWDTSSPMFVRAGPHGTATLFIPSVYISFNGEALDEKTTLLRSCDALSVAAVRLLRIMGDADVARVRTTLGTEQEFFLVDRGTYRLRPDLKITGRTVMGAAPPKHQQLEDHYFGKMPSRVIACMSECELELYKLGVPIKTRHNEVAPNQFEVAPIFEDASVAVDHNLLLMATLHEVAHRHGLKVLFHEKPFKGINGSGKHCNWSMATDSGDNLLDPTANPEKNPRFLLFLVAVLDAVNRHGALLRATIASASNEHRLGAHEAPPGIVSVFLGDHLAEVLDAVAEGRPVKSLVAPSHQAVRLGGTVLDLKVASLPTIARDLTDRNRTSPFAFTGNKFEFRAVGSSQSPSFPTAVLNAAVAESLTAIADTLEARKGGAATASTSDVMDVVQELIKTTKRIRFEGNNYSQEWAAEAARRGLPNIKSSPVAFKKLLEPEHMNVLVKQGIMSEAEVKARYHILVDKYVKDQMIEANTVKDMVRTRVLPGVFSFSKGLAESVAAHKTAGIDVDSLAEKRTLERVAGMTTKLFDAADELEREIAAVEALADEEAAAEMAGRVLTVAIGHVREAADALEAVVGDSHWPFPKYADLLF
nr:hypothetical protein HK105_005290 [Polyrhizophydium stewartii]